MDAKRALSGPEKCVACQGTGLVECSDHEYLTVHDCRACGGTGDSKMEPMFP